METLTNKNWLIAAALLFVAPVAGYITINRLMVPSAIPENHPQPQPARIEPPAAKNINKAPLVHSPAEYVMIGENRFEIMAPWLGHRIEAGEPGEMDLVMLPVDLVLEKRKIYVTAGTRDAFVRMAAAAAADGIELMADSGYRSVAYQQRIYLRKMAEGKDFYEIALGVAPPGYSEHSLGTTLDLVPSKWTFNGTPAEQWLLRNAADFRFTQSYPEKSDLGFTWEPWHWKYVGAGTSG